MSHFLLQMNLGALLTAFLAHAGFEKYVETSSTVNHFVERWNAVSLLPWRASMYTYLYTAFFLQGYMELTAKIRI